MLYTLDVKTYAIITKKISVSGSCNHGAEEMQGILSDPLQQRTVKR